VKRDETRPAGTSVVNANDNTPVEAQQKIDAVVIRIASLIGRQMAREAFQARSAANDNQEGEEAP
jgi:hypothetical protein